MEKKSLKKQIGFDTLLEKVVSSNICAGCGACFAVCPFKGVLEYAKEKPVLVGECKNCGICLGVCPRYNLQIEDIEEFIFGRRRKPEEAFGINEKVYVARSTSKEILGKCQDGGVATSLIASSLDSGEIDGAIVSGIDSVNPWLPKPLFVTKSEDAVSSSGTRYTYSPSLIALKEAVSKGLQRVAFVGTPCQILALRRIQRFPLKKYSNPVSFTLGLFCSECFSYDGLMVEKIQKNLGINLMDIRKVNIKGRLLVQKADGGVVGIPLKEAKAYALPKCQFCGDFSAELADISLGGVGLDGWTFTVLRTSKGLDVFKRALDKGILEVKSVEEFKSAFDLLVKLSNSKRENIRKIN